MRVFKTLAVALALALVGQAFIASPVARAQGETIKIASQSPLSGGQSVLGTAIRNGVDLSVQQNKANLEKMGFKVEFVPFDDQAKPDVGVSNAQNIVNDKAILAVVGHLNSGVAIPSSEVYNKADLAMVSPANTNVKITDRGLPTVNRICGRDDAQGAAGANYAISVLKAKTVYILHDKSAYGEGVATSFRDTIKAAGGVEILGFEGTEEKSDFDKLLTPIAAVKPDVLYFGGIYDQGGPLFKQARGKGIKATFMGADGLDSSDTAKLAGDAAVGIIYTTTAGPASVFPDAKQFVTDYKKAFKDLNPEPYAAEGYASTQVVLAGIEKAVKDNGGKLPTRKQVAAAIRATKGFKAITGTISFDGNGDPETAAYYILKAGSAKPEDWGKNEIVFTTTAPSPLMAKAMMSATAAPTAAK